MGEKLEALNENGMAGFRKNRQREAIQQEIQDHLKNYAGKIPGFHVENHDTYGMDSGHQSWLMRSYHTPEAAQAYVRSLNNDLPPSLKRNADGSHPYTVNGNPVAPSIADGVSSIFKYKP